MRWTTPDHPALRGEGSTPVPLPPPMPTPKSFSVRVMSAFERTDRQGPFCPLKSNLTVPHECMDERAVPQGNYIRRADRQRPVKCLERGVEVRISEPDHQSGSSKRGRIIL